jgi:hypothetical protein
MGEKTVQRGEGFLRNAKMKSDCRRKGGISVYIAGNAPHSCKDLCDLTELDHQSPSDLSRYTGCVMTDPKVLVVTDGSEVFSKLLSEGGSIDENALLYRAANNDSIARVRGSSSSPP